MCEQQNNVPVGDTSNAQPVVEQPLCGVSQSLKQYYLEQARLLCPAVTPESPETLRLEVLLRKTKRIINVLSHFNRPWVSGSRDIQKACAHYLIHAGLSKEDREAFVLVQGEMVYTICYLAACSDFISQMRRYFRNQEKELKGLLDSQKKTELQEKAETC